jgi:hypothetical protein
MAKLKLGAIVEDRPVKLSRGDALCQPRYRSRQNG